MSRPTHAPSAIPPSRPMLFCTTTSSDGPQKQIYRASIYLLTSSLLTYLFYYYTTVYITKDSRRWYVCWLHHECDSCTQRCSKYPIF